MNYEYFHVKSRSFLALAILYDIRGNFEDALWCCDVALELEDKAWWSLVIASQTTKYQNQSRLRLIEETTNRIKGKIKQWNIK